MTKEMSNYILDNYTWMDYITCEVECDGKFYATDFVDGELVVIGEIK